MNDRLGGQVAPVPETRVGVPQRPTLGAGESMGVVIRVAVSLLRCLAFAARAQDCAALLRQEWMGRGYLRAARCGRREKDPGLKSWKSSCKNRLSVDAVYLPLLTTYYSPLTLDPAQK